MSARLRDQDGAIALLTAVILLALMAAAAVAVDVGRLALTSRDQQGATDRAALDGVLAISGDGDPFITGPAAVLSSLSRNLGVSGTGMSDPRQPTAIEVGSWDDTNGFQALPPGSLLPNAIRVVTTSSVGSLFLPGTSPVVSEAVAKQDTLASISAASRVAAISGGELNSVLSGLLGTELALDAVSWEGLAQTGLNLGALAAELGVGSVEELLDLSVSYGELAAAAARALPADGDAASVALGQVSMDHPGLPQVRLGDILAVESGGGSAFGTDVNAFDLLLAAAQAVNRGNFVDLDLAAPNVLGARLHVIEPPVIAIGRAGRNAEGEFRTVARTSQVGLTLDVPITGTINLGLPGVGSITLLDRMTIQVDAARGRAGVSSARCGEPGAVTVDATSATAAISLPPTNVATVVVRTSILLVGTINIARVTATASSQSTVGTANGMLDFTGPFPTASQEVGTSAPGIGGLIDNLQVTTTTEILYSGLGSLLGSLVNPIAAALVPAVTGLLTPILGGLDDTVAPALELLGVDLGSVHVRALDVECSGRVLVDPNGNG